MSCSGSEQYFSECAHEVPANGDCGNAAMLCGKSSSKGLQYYPHLWELFVKFYNNHCSTMRGRIKGTDSTINAILAKAVLYELRWKIWNGAE